MFSIDEFVAKGLTGGGARPSLFKVIITPPFAVSAAGAQIQFLCQAASIPGVAIPNIDVPYMGRKTKQDGFATFQDWTVNILNDEDFGIRGIMEKWFNLQNSFQGNVRATNNIRGTGLVYQLSKNGDQTGILRSYEFVGMLPNNLEAISLDWDRSNSIESFSTTFGYNYWRPVDQGQAKDVYDVDSGSGATSIIGN